jgi:hypothetical protein
MMRQQTSYKKDTTMTRQDSRHESNYRRIDELMFLNHETPPGLFLTEEQDEYLVVATNHGMRAILLRSSCAASFSVTELTPHRLDYGWYKGPSILRLKGCSFNAPGSAARYGMITTGDHALFMSCFALDGSDHEVPLGYADSHIPEGFDGSFFDHWDVVEKGTGSVFFEREFGREYEWHQSGIRVPRPTELITVEFVS